MALWFFKAQYLFSFALESAGIDPAGDSEVAKKVRVPSSFKPPAIPAYLCDASSPPPDVDFHLVLVGSDDGIIPAALLTVWATVGMSRFKHFQTFSNTYQN